MDYNHITSFLDKFKKLIYQKEEIREIVTKTISLELSHQIGKGLIKIKGPYIYIESSPMLRSEILIHKKQILDNLKSVLPENVFFDIR